MQVSTQKFMRSTMALLAGLLALTSIASVAHADARSEEAATRAMVWALGQQQADGSFPGFGAGSTVDALLAIAAMGHDPGRYNKGGKNPVQFLESKAAELAKTPGGAGKLLLGVASIARDGREFGGMNLEDAINAGYDPSTGQYGKDVIGHAFVILGLKAAGWQVQPRALDFLDSTQTASGGWSFSGDKKEGAADTNSTAVALQAYVALGAQDHAHQQIIRSGWAYLMSQQNPDGGFPYQQGGEFGSNSDVNSTAYVIQALIALGATEEIKKPVEWMLSMQKPNSAFRWMATETDDNPGATYQAIPVLLGRALTAPALWMQPGGMPRSGQSDPRPVAALAAFMAMALGTGLMLRRRASTR